MRDYKKIKAWEFGDKLAYETYLATRDYPKDEIYGLISQMRRCAVSVPANIVEGSGRNSNKEYLQFLYISKSSARELEYYLHLSSKLGYLSSFRYKKLSDLCDETSKVLFGLITAVSSEVKS